MTDGDRGAARASQLAGWCTVLAVGAVTAVACLLRGGPVAVYLIGAGVTAAAGTALAVLGLRGRPRAASVGVVVLAAVASVVVPWHLAQAARTGDALWSLDTAGPAQDVRVHSSGLLFADQDGLHAVDRADGRVLWSATGPAPVGGFDVAADGHVLVRFAGTDGLREAVWLSPAGDELWRHVAGPTDDGPAAGGQVVVEHEAYARPVAAADGVLVVVACGPAARSCSYVGIGPDGRQVWSRPGAPWSGVGSGAPSTNAPVHVARVGHPALPRVAVVAAPDSPSPAERPAGTRVPAEIVDAADGASVADLEIQDVVAVVGDLVVHDAGPATTAGRCRLDAVDAEGVLTWTSEPPCLIEGVTAGDRYLHADGPSGSVVVDATTGRWAEIAGSGGDAVPGDDVVLRRAGAHVEGLDPATGRQLWRRPLSDPAHVPTLTSGHGAAVLLSPAGRSSNPFLAAVEAAPGAAAVLVLEDRTGAVTAGLTTTETIWSTTPTGPGQAAVAMLDRIVLLGDQDT
ncbi:PQQ-binding-like beta-propeller repeat protein [Nocardioides zeae]|uniref:PQQ-binding-like beta-propeller repeat protein n=1 Tax=Nocardioides imazamoxiresistens TaxID=3231893 RepID=A0ABU3PUI1_9ACTN|nr:PQQ-binding-like beta-propeller repeat protein [Nocardioides zeae]MDT9592829.1 PQQ-binding-like beta-propeller repeat protein [Nocardioides zeae]